MELVAEDGAILSVSEAPPRLGGEAAVYDAVAAGIPCVVKVAWQRDTAGAWLDRERELLASLGADPATAVLVPAVLHHGRWDGRPFMALERFPATLHDVIAARPPLEDRLRIAARVAGVCERLRQARPELVHRDIKPSNLLLDGERVVITDLGIARDLVLGATTTGALLTPDYAAPEQSLPRRRADPSWDTFGLAATLFHLITGEPASTPGPNAWRLTPRGVALRSGRDDGTGEAWDYLDLRGADALSRGDRRALDATVRGPLRQALEAAMAPDPRRRSGTPATLREAVLASRPVRPRRWPWVAAAASLAVGAAVLSWRPAPEYPMVLVDAEPPFLLGVTEVDQALWTRVMGSTLATRRSLGPEGLGPPCTSYEGRTLEAPDLPMVCVSFVEAVQFADALSRLRGLRPAHRVERKPDGAWHVERVDGADGYRLPTLEEWRLAITPRPGEEAARENAAGDADGFPVASPVGSMPPGPRGIRDGYGNVNEWLWDEPEPGLRQVAGGQWGARPEAFPFAFSSKIPAVTRQQALGIRLARALE